MKLIALGTAAAALFCAFVASSQPAPVRMLLQAAGGKGEALFKQRCAMCHMIAGKGGKLGPDLTGVAGRKAGSTGFAYSPAMKASKKVWNAASLDAYLAAPAKAIPGTRMVVAVPNADDRKAIIAYLTAARK